MTQIQSDNYFAIIPEWVLYAPISANAIRLYCVLNRYANAHGKAWPSRKSIAESMNVSPATVDRAKEELEEIGAITVEQRRNPAGDPTSNLYTLHTATSSPVMRGIRTREDTGIPTRDDQNRVSMNESQIRDQHQCETCNGRKVILPEPIEVDGYKYYNKPEPCPECQ